MIPRVKESSRDPVSGGEVECWKSVLLSSLSPIPSPPTSRSSRRGREQTMLKSCEAGHVSQSTPQESVRNCERNESLVPRTIPQAQPHNIGKRLNPATLFCKRVGDDLCATDPQPAGITCRRISRIRESLFPGLEVIEVIEVDITEKLPSGACNP